MIRSLDEFIQKFQPEITAKHARSVKYRRYSHALKQAAIVLHQEHSVSRKELAQALVVSSCTIDDWFHKFASKGARLPAIIKPVQDKAAFAAVRVKANNESQAIPSSGTPHIIIVTTSGATIRIPL